MLIGFILGMLTLYGYYYLVYNSLNSKFQDSRLIGSYRCDIRSDKDIDSNGELNISVINGRLYEIQISHGWWLNTTLWFTPDNAKRIARDILEKQ